MTGDKNEVTQPRFFAALGLNDGQDHTMEGLIPYCWGGSDGPGDVYNKTANRSPEHLWYAGNIDSKYSDGTYHNFISYTTGVDCSGFITNIFHLPERLSTLDLMDSDKSPFRKVGTGLWKNGEFGDILLKDSHVMFIWSYETVNDQITGTYVGESTTRSSLDKVGSDFWNATYCNQFHVYRYQYWLD